MIESHIHTLVCFIFLVGVTQAQFRWIVRSPANPIAAAIPAEENLKWRSPNVLTNDRCNPANIPYSINGKIETDCCFSFAFYSYTSCPRKHEICQWDDRMDFPYFNYRCECSDSRMTYVNGVCTCPTGYVSSRLGECIHQDVLLVDGFKGIFYRETDEGQYQVPFQLKRNCIGPLCCPKNPMYTQSYNQTCLLPGERCIFTNPSVGYLCTPRYGSIYVTTDYYNEFLNGPIILGERYTGYRKLQAIDTYQVLTFSYDLKPDQVLAIEDYDCFYFTNTAPHGCCRQGYSPLKCSKPYYGCVPNEYHDWVCQRAPVCSYLSPFPILIHEYIEFSVFNFKCIAECPYGYAYKYEIGECIKKTSITPTGSCGTGRTCCNPHNGYPACLTTRETCSDYPYQCTCKGNMLYVNDVCRCPPQKPIYDPSDGYCKVNATIPNPMCTESFAHRLSGDGSLVLCDDICRSALPYWPSGCNSTSENCGCRKSRFSVNGTCTSCIATTGYLKGAATSPTNCPAVPWNPDNGVFPCSSRSTACTNVETLLPGLQWKDDVFRKCTPTVSISLYRKVNVLFYFWCSATLGCLDPTQTIDIMQASCLIKTDGETIQMYSSSGEPVFSYYGYCTPGVFDTTISNLASKFICNGHGSRVLIVPIWDEFPLYSATPIMWSYTQLVTPSTTCQCSFGWWGPNCEYQCDCGCGGCRQSDGVCCSGTGYTNNLDIPFAWTCAMDAYKTTCNDTNWEPPPQTTLPPPTFPPINSLSSSTGTPSSIISSTSWSSSSTGTSSSSSSSSIGSSSSWSTPHTNSSTSIALVSSTGGSQYTSSMQTSSISSVSSITSISSTASDLTTTPAPVTINNGTSTSSEFSIFSLSQTVSITIITISACVLALIGFKFIKWLFSNNNNPIINRGNYAASNTNNNDNRSSYTTPNDNTAF